MSSEKEIILQHLYQPQERFVSIKLDRGQKGGYGWEIKAEAKTFGEALDVLIEADAGLRTLFLPKNKEVTENG